MTQIYVLAVTEHPCGILPEVFRPYKLITNVEAPHLSTLVGIFINSRPQLIGSVDAWQFSAKYQTELAAQFLQEHGLTGKSDLEIDEYLDENDLSVPSTGRLILPTMRKGDTIRVSKEGKDFTVALIGYML